MKKQNLLSAYIFIGIGIYFLLKQFNIPLLSKFYGWPTILMIIGSALFLYSLRGKQYDSIFSGVLVLGIGIHFHILHNYSFWTNHWAVYVLMTGIAFLIRSIWTKQGLIAGLILTIISSMIIFSWSTPHWLKSPFQLIRQIDTFWPIAVIILGIFLLKRS